MKKQRLSKWVGHFLTMAIFWAAVSPNTFNISASIHPWVFIFSIVWIIAYSSGVIWP